MRVTRHLYEVDGWGVGEVWTHDGNVVHHELASPDLARLREGAAGAPDAEAARDSAGLVPDLCRRFALHLHGGRVGYDDVPVDLDWGTPLQQALAVSLRAVPWGEVVSYGELAALAGRPGAARAAGAFCAENRFALILPCHRVVAANGIGGYGAGGVALKRRLLELEGVSL